MKLAMPLILLNLLGCGTPDPCVESRHGGEVCQRDGGMAADAGLAIQVIESTCASPCDRTRPSCEVTREGAVVTLTLLRRSCPAPPTTVVCVAACAISGAICSVPALPAGEYVLRSAGHPDVGLSVGAGTAVSCAAAVQSE